jgi:hypothetical protein
MIAYSPEFSVNCFKWEDFKQTAIEGGVLALFTGVNFALAYAQHVWLTSEYIPGVSIKDYENFTTYNKGNLPIVFLEEYNAIVFNFQDVKAHDNSDIGRILKYTSNTEVLNIKVGDNFYRVKFKNIDPTIGKYFTISNAVTMKGYVVLKLSYTPWEEDFKLGFGTIVEDKQNGGVVYSIEDDEVSFAFPGTLVTFNFGN